MSNNFATRTFATGLSERWRLTTPPDPSPYGQRDRSGIGGSQLQDAADTDRLVGTGLRRREAAMRAVWSFWTRPYVSHHNRVWLSEKHHLLSWVLSFETARRHYPETVLVTDDRGANLLIGQLGLPFGCVSTELNDLRGEDPEWWVLGKLRAIVKSGVCEVDQAATLLSF